MNAIAEAIMRANAEMATDEEAALDHALDAVDSALHAGDFSGVNEALVALDFDMLNLDVAVLVLMATKPPPPAAGLLPDRPLAVERFTRRLQAREPEHAAGILPFL